MTTIHLQTIQILGLSMIASALVLLTKPSVLQTVSVVRGDDPTTKSATSEAQSPQKKRETVTNSVAFIVQAPLGQWSDPRYQDGCEEASALMAIRWAQGRGEMSAKQSSAVIADIARYEEETLGAFQDTSTQDTLDVILNGYFQFQNATRIPNITADDIRNALSSNSVIMVPVNGQKLGNPFYTPPGPDRHMLLVTGYDASTNEFIVNDPGTRRGKGYRYSASRLNAALADYPTGDHSPAQGHQTAMIVVQKNR